MRYHYTTPVRLYIVATGVVRRNSTYLALATGGGLWPTGRLSQPDHKYTIKNSTTVATTTASNRQP